METTLIDLAALPFEGLLSREHTNPIWTTLKCALGGNVLLGERSGLPAQTTQTNRVNVRHDCRAHQSVAFGTGSSLLKKADEDGETDDH